MNIRVGERAVGGGEPCMLVAEIGINHNGDMALGKRMIEAAARAGADAAKFQNYRTEDFISNRSLTYQYISQGKTVIESQYDLFKRCELKPEAMRELKAHCDACGVQFHSTPTSEEGIRDLIEVGAPVLKNGSDYLTHLPLICAMGKTGLPTVISTGMALPEETTAAVEAFRSTGNQQLVLLHCTSSYPTPPADTHLRKIPALAAAHGCLIGFSDHTEGVEAALGAVALGACWIEKHFTLDTNLPGPDHRFSSDPAQFSALSAAVRKLELSLGETRLGPAASEAEGRLSFRLSCVTARALRAGDLLAEGDLAFRRPGTGLPPASAAALIGRRLARPLAAGHVIAMQDLE